MKYEQPVVETYEASDLLELLGPAQGMSYGGGGGGVTGTELLGPANPGSRLAKR